MKTYEVKRGHGWFSGKQKESDTVGTIDTGMQFQHTLVGIYDDYNHCVVDPDNAETVQAQYYKQHRGNILLIKNATKQGYLEAEEGDGIDISSRMEYHRGTVQTNVSQTILSGGGCNGVVVNAEKPKVIGGFGEMKSNSGTQYYLQDRVYDNEIATTTTTTKEGFQPSYVDNQLRIRKLTPRECFRLMGVKDEDSDKIHLSDMNLYHLAGDSIIVDVLMRIFRKML